MANRLMTWVVAGIVALMVLSSVTFTVDERDYVALFAFGEIQRTDFKPGLHFKLPPPFQNIKRFDRRLLTLDSQPELFLTSEQKNVLVDFYVKWRIKDVRKYYQAVGVSQEVAKDRLSDIIRNGLKNEFSKRTIREVVSGERGKIMRDMSVSANEPVASLGIEIRDVRIQRIDYAENIADSVYNQMRSDRAKEATDIRAQGAEEAEKIRAKADAERVVITANAFSTAEQLRGVGDARAADIYASAYGKNPEFYSFYRSLEAYKESLSDSGDILVLEPKGEFFQYFNPPAR